MLKKVFHYPCSAWNPYNLLLKFAIEQNSTFQVTLITGKKQSGPHFPKKSFLGWLFQLPGKNKIIHLHWIGSMTSSNNLVVMYLKSISFAFFLLALRVTGIKFVITLHNLVPHDKGHTSHQIFIRKHLLKLFDAIIIHTPAARVFAGKRLNLKNNVAIIPHPDYVTCYSTKITQDEGRKRLGLPLDGKILLFFGMIKPYKNVGSLADLLKNHPEHHLLVAGRGNSALFGNPANNNIILHDKFIDDSDVPYYFASADVVLLPTVSESAMTSGTAYLCLTFDKPMIVSDHIAFSEFISRGLAFPSTFQPEDFFAVLNQVFSLDTEQFHRKCKEYKTKTSLENVGLLHAEVYDAVLTGRTIG